jgi:hypothetical protein
MAIKAAKIIGWNPSQVRKDMTEKFVALQTERLIEYAEKTIVDIGNKIQTYNSRNHMDRTGNLLNSLCWGVAYNGKLKGSGFYRNASSIKESYLHEWGDYKGTFAIDGHARAQEYIEKYGKVGSGNGTWRVFFAILAPYWGYWEEGFTFKGVRGERFLRFAVMTEFYDKISEELKPAKTSFHVTKEINYTQSYNWTDSKGKSHRVSGSLERMVEGNRYKSRR